MAYLSIDPGIDTGYAFFKSAGEMVACGMGDPRKVKFDSPVRTVLIEKPKIYPARLSKGDPNDLIVLALQVGRYLEFFESRGAKTHSVIPYDWKGNAPKHVTEAWARRGLTMQETGVVVAAIKFVAVSKQHNVWDAIALGRHGFERRLWA